MIDHMLVNLKKYYESKFPCYIGMNIKAPKSSLPAYYMADSPVDGADMLPSTAKPSLTPAELENKEVIAQRLNGMDDFYLLIQPAGYYSYINCWIKLSDLIQNGGVSASLTHVCHALSLVRKELSMANNVLKILFDKDMYIRATKGNSQLVAIGAKTAIEVSEPNNAHENIEQHNPLLVYVTSYDNNYYRIVDFNGYPFYSTHTWDGETYKDDNWLKNDATYTVRKEEVLQIGGVLRRLYTKLCGAFRKQVVVC